MGSESITVVTLDMQLYDLAMKLWVEREDIRNHFLFRPGELHIVFWALSALGKYIEGSGIDQAWVEAGLHLDDMEKSNREPPFPSVTCCIWLGTSCGRRGIYTYSMFSSPSS